MPPDFAMAACVSKLSRAISEMADAACTCVEQQLVRCARPRREHQLIARAESGKKKAAMPPPRAEVRARTTTSEVDPER